MSEAKYTADEIRKAWGVAVEKATGHYPGTPQLGDVLAELERPEIAPDVPVIYDLPWSYYPGRIARFGGLPRGAINIRVLISEDTVLEWVDEWQRGDNRDYLPDYIRHRIAAYKREGK